MGENNNITHANMKWNEYYGDRVNYKPHTKVHFPEKDLVKIHYLIAWQFAHKHARKCYWEQCARDRVRFENRIANTEALLENVLKNKISKFH